MQGANLSLTKMQGSDCGATFIGALVASADLSCVHWSISQEQLQFTVGDADTIVPEGLQVWSCLDRAALPPETLAEIDTALTHHPVGDDPLRLSRAEFEDALFCDEGEVPRKVGRYPEPAAVN